MDFAEFQPNFFKVEQHDDVVVATFVNSHLTDEVNIEELGHELFALIDHFNCHKVLCDLHAVMYVTSSVIGKLITMHRKLHRQDGTFGLCDVQSTVMDILDTSRLITYFKIFDSAEEALKQLD